MLIDLIVLVFLFVFGWEIIGMLVKTKCQNCGSRFSYMRKSRILEKTASVEDREIFYYENTYKCNSCGSEEKNVPEIVEIK